jgi:triacylglycerol lipase
MEHIEHCHKMAQMASIAYLDGREAGPKFKVHIVGNRNEMVLAFRGTEPDEFSDLTADLNAFPDRAQVGGWVHNGFQNELEKVWTDVLKILGDELGGRALYICGHSLGGAMATVAASRLNPHALYTYGSPRVGTKKFVKNITCPHYRHVNNNDIVPKVPFAWLGYRHHGELQYINFYGNIRKMTRWQRFKDGWRGRVAAWKKREPFDGARDHGMANYVKYLEKK